MIINFRLKSAGMYWLRRNAQSVLLLRSYMKSGRFDWRASQPASW